MRILCAWFHEPQQKSLPWEVYKNLTDHGKKICRFIVADSSDNVDTSLHDDLGYGLKIK